MREVIAEAEADHDIVSLVAALSCLPHVLAYQGEATAARAAAKAAIESAAELGDVYVGGSHMASMLVHLAAGDVAAGVGGGRNRLVSHSAACKEPRR